ncbi:hypothetical protein [Chondromyces crocatus]|uniref:Uncharacterized protein n=1 Tax=Chondromyces crocatus TaxID=52 RepID=A0A0K1EK19_CHOCO|nr:hypothetical protein [Chondromyces crocatus]AKT41210.1 uncharacterized protein CMC5_053710 [Chondromyces crocatus]
MLIAAHHLIDRLRHPRTRADDLAALRRRFAAVRPPTQAEDEAAQELRRQRLALSAALSEVTSCGGCAKGHPLPAGQWQGGHCCSGRTEGVFTDDEVAALRFAGTSHFDLMPPHAAHAGCVFRGPTGCSLRPEHRPNICVRYLCRELEDELRERGQLSAVKALSAELGRAFKNFVRLRPQEGPEDGMDGFPLG